MSYEKLGLTAAAVERVGFVLQVQDTEVAGSPSRVEVITRTNFRWR